MPIPQKDQLQPDNCNWTDKDWFASVQLQLDKIRHQLQPVPVAVAPFGIKKLNWTGPLNTTFDLSGHFFVHCRLEQQPVKPTCEAHLITVQTGQHHGEQ